MPFITFKTAYQILLKSSVRRATAQRSLESSLHLTNADWKKICMLPKLTTIESSLRSFQDKIEKREGCGISRKNGSLITATYHIWNHG